MSGNEGELTRKARIYHRKAVEWLAGLEEKRILLSGIENGPRRGAKIAGTDLGWGLEQQCGGLEDELVCGRQFRSKRSALAHRSATARAQGCGKLSDLGL